MCKGFCFCQIWTIASVHTHWHDLIRLKNSWPKFSFDGALVFWVTMYASHWYLHISSARSIPYVPNFNRSVTIGTFVWAIHFCYSESASVHMSFVTSCRCATKLLHFLFLCGTPIKDTFYPAGVCSLMFLINSFLLLPSRKVHIPWTNILVMPGLSIWENSMRFTFILWMHCDL